jgi:hypothetical protein
VTFSELVVIAPVPKGAMPKGGMPTPTMVVVVLVSPVAMCVDPEVTTVEVKLSLPVAVTLKPPGLSPGAAGLPVMLAGEPVPGTSPVASVALGQISVVIEPVADAELPLAIPLPSRVQVPAVPTPEVVPAPPAPQADQVCPIAVAYTIMVFVMVIVIWMTVNVAVCPEPVIMAVAVAVPQEIELSVPVMIATVGVPDTIQLDHAISE